MAKNRVSETDLTRIKPLQVYSNSPESLDIDPRHIRVVTGTVVERYIVGTGGSSVDYEVNDEEYEAPGVPHLADISIVKNASYVDKKGNVRSRIIFRVKNSSGEAVNGVDARLELLGGTDQ